LFDRPQSGTRAVLLHLDLTSQGKKACLQEFADLANAAGIDTAAVVRGSRKLPNPRYFIGTGKAEEVRRLVADKEAELVLVNHALTPVQERNLEKYLGCRVVDRTGLILDIFAQRASTFEGKLQVELAQLRHLSTRLVRGWTHLERQKGGIGLRGPGETQLETDRRLITGRIRHLKRRLDKVQKQRSLQRKSRRKSQVSTISLVGYTNAGKSTLFNLLTGEAVHASSQLFATLDPTLRRIHLPPLDEVVLADTVGFIRDLPHQLVAAFRSTLEETSEATLLLHVIDAHDEERHERIAQVEQVLKEIGADTVPMIEVYNKIDLLDEGQARIDRGEDGKPLRVWLSAHSGAGLDLLRQALSEHLTAVHIPMDPGVIRQRLYLQPRAARLRDKLFQWKVVRGESMSENGGWIVDVAVGEGVLGYLKKQQGCQLVSE